MSMGRELVTKSYPPPAFCHVASQPSRWVSLFQMSPFLPGLRLIIPGAKVVIDCGAAQFMSHPASETTPHLSLEHLYAWVGLSLLFPRHFSILICMFFLEESDDSL